MSHAEKVEAEVQRIYSEIDNMDKKVEIAVEVLAREKIKAAQFRTRGEARIVSIRHAAIKMGVE